MKKTRIPLVMGNWKLNGNKKTISQLIFKLKSELPKIQNCIVSIAPPEVYLDFVRKQIKNSFIFLSAQNVDINLFGPFTGETSAKMLKEVGVKYTIIGHSERRLHHKESDELIAKKFFVLKKQNLIPVLCIGETEEENKTGKTEKVCSRQIDAILKKYGISLFNDSIIAYEPVWAIGTGKSASPNQIQIVHKFIRNYIAKYDEKIADRIIIQYGGSVNSSNVKELLSQPDIDGVLVGKASLEIDTFKKIVKTAEKLRKSNIN